MCHGMADAIGQRSGREIGTGNEEKTSTAAVKEEVS